MRPKGQAHQTAYGNVYLKPQFSISYLTKCPEIKVMTPNDLAVLSSALEKRHVEVHLTSSGSYQEGQPRMGLRLRSNHGAAQAFGSRVPN